MRYAPIPSSTEWETLPEEEAGVLKKNGEKEYAKKMIHSRIQDLQITSQILALIFIVRMATGVAAQFDDPNTWSIALPCYTLNAVLLIILNIFFAVIIRREKIWDVNYYDRLVKGGGFLVSILVLLTIVAIKKFERDIPGRLMGCIVVFIMLMEVYSRVIQNFSNMICFILIYILMVYWCFGKECEQVEHIMGMGTLLIINFLYKIHNILKQSHDKFINDWKTQQDKNLYESLLLVLKDPVCIIDSERILFSNTACRENLKMNAYNYRSVLASFILQGENNLLEEIDKRFLNSLPIGISCKNFTKKNVFDSRNRLYKIFMIDHNLDQSQNTIALVFRDLTEEKELEEKRIQQQFQQVLFLSLSHEVRTPLNAIQGLISFIRGLKGIDKSLLSKIKAGKHWCSILSSEISNILDYAHIAFGKFQVHSSKINISKLIKRINRFLHTLLDEKISNIEVNIKADPSCKEIIILDEERLIQILINVLWSIVKRINTGYISIKIILNDNFLKFHIIDTGDLLSFSLVNILNEEVSDVSDEQNTENIRLVMSKMILHGMGGKLKIKYKNEYQESMIKFPVYKEIRENIFSEESKDLVEFIRPISVPSILVNSNSLSIKSNKTNKKCMSEKYFQTKCLVVDDVKMNRFILRAMAEKQGFEVTEARNGVEAVREAFSMASQGNRILIFMDFDMPEMNGVEATRRIRKLENILQPVIIAVTAFSGEDERSLCEKAGMNGFIAKPITQRAIKKIIADFYIT